MKLFSIPISQIRQYSFCPRIPYYQIIQSAPKQNPLWLQQGLDFQSKWEEMQKRRKLTRFGIEEQGKVIKHVLVESNELGIHGVIDFVIEIKGEWIPVEIKRRFSALNEGTLLQLVAYAMAAEEQKQIVVKRGFVYYDNKGKVIEIQISKELREKVKNVILKIQKAVSEELLPESSASIGKCAQCEYLRNCNDRNF
jgi:CRISPR-associated exonuclease Cas4